MTANAPTDSPATFSGISVFFVVLMAALTGYFLFWGASYTNGNATLLLVLATVFGLFMAFNIGGNDVANSFGTSVGAGTLTIRQALFVAAIFEVSGAVIAGGEVTSTIRGGIVDLGAFEIEPTQFIYIMMSALIAAALWLLFATKRGYPVSTTHSIVGAIVGSSVTLGVMLNGADSALALVQWDRIGAIAVSWVLSPLLGGAVSYALYHQIRHHVLTYNERAEERLKEIRAEKEQARLRHKEAFERLSEIQQISYTHSMNRDLQAISDEDFNAEDLESDYYREIHRINKKHDEIDAYYALQTWVPFIAAIGAMIIASMVLFKGLNRIDLGLSTLNNYLIVGMIGAGVWMAVYIFAKTLKGASLGKSTFLMFSWMQVFTASGFAFSHGSNDIANAIGPFAAILDVLRTNAIGTEAATPPAVMITFGVALIVGLWFIGKEVIRTVGHALTKMHPASGFAAELSAAAVVMLASMLGLPVSSTHILIGSVLGIGLVNRQTNWELMKPIGLAWIITLPAAAALSAMAFLLMNALL